MSTIRLNDLDGSVTDYTINALDDITVQDWTEIAIAEVVDQQDERDVTLDIIHRWTKIPIEKLRRMPVGAVEKLSIMVGQALGEAAAAKVNEWMPSPLMEVCGKRWKVPMNIEADTIFAQWADLNARLDRVTEERDIIPLILAVLLVEEGTEYDGSAIPERVALFKGAPAGFGLRMTAFFFDSGKRLHDAMNRYMSRILHSAQQSLQQVATASSSGMGG